MYDSKRLLIWENDNFILSSSTIPHNDKFDGGHLTIRPKVTVQSISELSDEILLEMYKVVRAGEKALIEVLNEQGIDVPFTNNQDNGNWSVFAGKSKSLHIHIYGRARNSTKQIFGQALYFPDPHTTFYDNNTPFDKGDILKIREKVDKYF
jgi:diadenosine tetraphosphate (Ap4A) HIT family hydrolase